MPELEFKGKQHLYAHHLAVPYRPLVPDRARSVGAGGQDDNLIIHGDNLDALKALLPRYAARVKCVYIDPPYNTGNEGWAYNDKVNAPLMREWLERNGVVDGEDLERHDKWLCMMWPRLRLLKELLADDGAIFVSIDDNELHHLRMIMNEIFGEENFRNIIAIRRGVKNVQSQFEHVDRLNAGQEYMLFFSRRPDTKFAHLTAESNGAFAGSWNNHWRGTDRPTMRYELMGRTPDTGQWRWSREKSLKGIANYEKLLEEIGADPNQKDIDEWWFAQSPDKPDLLRMSRRGRPEHYVPPSDRRILSSLWTDMTVNEHRSEMDRLGIVFDNPKRRALVERIVAYMTAADGNAIVLDSFAGSGTTAHAVLALNKEDGGRRKFILVECEDYADSITAERVRRVVRGVPEAKDAALREGLGGSFAYCTLGPPLEMETMLNGEALPAWPVLAAYLLHTASGVSAGAEDLAPLNDDGLFHRGGATDYYLIYEPDLAWLRGHGAVLNADRAERIAAANRAGEKKRKAVVFAAGKYIAQDELTPMGITFCQLPYELVGAGPGP